MVRIARAARTAVFPARFMLVGAMNPCPCGFLDDPVRRCRCSPEQTMRYAARLSGPLRDRIDLTVRVGSVPPRDLELAEAGETSADIRERVRTARSRQMARDGRLNCAASGSRAQIQGHAESRGANPAVAGADAVFVERARLRPRSSRRADDRRSGRKRTDRRAASGGSPAVSGRLSHAFVISRGRTPRGRVSCFRNHWAAQGGRRPRRAVASRRYSIVIADRSSGVVRRFTLPLGPTVATITTALALPILIGLGARWSAKATVDDLTATNARLSVENENYREATGQLSAQVSALAGRRR